PENRQPERLAPRATSNRNGGRDHLGILGEIKSEYPGEIFGISISVEANAPVKEQQETIIHACNALLGTVVAANELLGFTSASEQLGKRVDEFQAAGWFKRI
ncbi:hypothetical protein P0R31_37095, partial [Bradyrhizobium yuanmingense]|uniref:hypothetical protein n=1 Tax=Bradyrhizobium yuanmingense TaxID=108015 RepID=UPI0023B9BE5E